MARKPPDWRQPTLFPPDPDLKPEPKDNATPTEGDDHAVQDHRFRTPAGTQAPDDNGTPRQGAEDQPRGVEASAVPGQAGERPEPDSERSPGNGPPGAGGSFAARVTPGGRNAVPGRGNGVYSP